ncbi:hypothetical protein [Bradyrhizobium elkanii]|uniref:hypothetical protein n=1 Tax=Bradyrhizobium elkanii TaxID=29448 RepID=UPI00114C882D|nr:hypothetical protein [Bradyrhizobium elkanii]
MPEEIHQPAPAEARQVQKALGKAAKNEQRKLTATYLNNVAVAVFAAGIAIPVISGMNKTDEDWSAFFSSLFTYDGLQKLSANLATAICAIVASAILHRFARHVASQIED